MAVAPADIPAMAAARAVADAVLYEGYLLYPYRRSAAKNRIRWQFGVLLPPAWARSRGLDSTTVAGSAESWWQQTECLLEAGPAAEADIRVRFLQVQRRLVEERGANGSCLPAPEPGGDGRMELSFDEAVPREFSIRARVSDLMAAERRVPLEAAGGEEASPLDDGGGSPGRVVRQRLPVTASVLVSAEPCGQATGLARLRVRIENTGGVAQQAPRQEALRVSLIGCHVLLAVRDGRFVSLLEPPPAAREAARACANVHTFPVLAAPEGQRAVMLSSPIIMYDHPRVSPESPGDLFDATEIDEILTLRTLTMTEAEKKEARATDPRAAAILDRVEATPPEGLSRLHGALRSRRRDRRAEPWWDPGADAGVSPETDSVVVAGIPVAKGSRVRLRPRLRGADPQDMFLVGREARVEAVLHDVDGSVHLATTLADDPGADLHRWYGRFRYFSPDEVEPLTGSAAGCEEGH